MRRAWRSGAGSVFGPAEVSQTRPGVASRPPGDEIVTRYGVVAGFPGSRVRRYSHDGTERVNRCAGVVGLVVAGAARAQEYRPWDVVPPVEPVRFGPAPFRFPGSVNAVLISPDGRWLVARSYSEYHAWNLATGEPFGPPGVNYYGTAAVFSPDPK